MDTSYGTRGQRLWDNLLARDADLADESNPMREVAVSACRTADRVELLEIQCSFAEPLVETKVGWTMNPLFGETRQQEQVLARLVAALRLPDVASGKKPQHRSLRGVEQPPKLNVSSLERARQAKSS